MAISREDFSGPMRALLDQKRALGIAAELAQAGSRERGQVVDALQLVSQEVDACVHRLCTSKHTPLEHFAVPLAALLTCEKCDRGCWWAAVAMLP